MGGVFRLGFVVSEEELLLGQVSLALLGLSSALYVVFLQTGRSSDGPESGIAHHIWAGPHNSPSKLRFLSPSEEKRRGFDVSGRMEVGRVMRRACEPLLLTRYNLRSAAINFWRRYVPFIQRCGVDRTAIVFSRIFRQE